MEAGNHEDRGRASLVVLATIKAITGSDYSDALGLGKLPKSQAAQYSSPLNRIALFAGFHGGISRKRGRVDVIPDVAYSGLFGSARLLTVNVAKRGTGVECRRLGNLGNA